VPKPWQRGHFAPAAFQSEDGVIPALSHIRQVLVERPHSPHKQDTVFSPSHHRTIAPSLLASSWLPAVCVYILLPSIACSVPT